MLMRAYLQFCNYPALLTRFHTHIYTAWKYTARVTLLYTHIYTAYNVSVVVTLSPTHINTVQSTHYTRTRAYLHYL